jgi:hypothetical protein
MKPCYLIVLLSLIGKGTTNKNDLQTDIYDKCPPIIADNGINLSLSLAIRAFNNIDQIDGSINMNVWLRYEWYSDIKWIPNNYSNITSLNLNTNPDLDNFIWTPDIYLYNTAEKPMNELYYTEANVYNDGRIFWSRPGLIKSTCIFNLTYFPYDQQTCKLKFGSWSYDSTEIYLADSNNIIDTSNYQEHEEWNLIEYSSVRNSVKYECCENEYHDIEFYYTIRRKPDYYNLNIIIPTFATATLIILTLLVPWNSGERISFAVTVLLSIIVFLLIVSENLPKTDSKPLLSRMIIGLIYFSLVGVIFTIIISCIHNSIDNKTIKNNKLLLLFFSKCDYIKCCLTNRKNSENDENIENREYSDNESIHSIKTNNSIYSFNDSIDLEKCKNLTIKIEKIFILLFLLSFIIYCLVIFLSVPNYVN